MLQAALYDSQNSRARPELPGRANSPLSRLGRQRRSPVLERFPVTMSLPRVQRDVPMLMAEISLMQGYRAISTTFQGRNCSKRIILPLASMFCLLAATDAIRMSRAGNHALV